MDKPAAQAWIVKSIKLFEKVSLLLEHIFCEQYGVLGAKKAWGRSTEHNMVLWINTKLVNRLEALYP